MGGVAVLPTNLLTGVSPRVMNLLFRKGDQTMMRCQHPQLVNLLLAEADNPNVRDQILRSSYAHSEKAAATLVEVRPVHL